MSNNDIFKCRLCSFFYHEKERLIAHETGHEQERVRVREAIETCTRVGAPFIEKECLLKELGLVGEAKR